MYDEGGKEVFGSRTGDVEFPNVAKVWQPQVPGHFCCISGKNQGVDPEEMRASSHHLDRRPYPGSGSATAQPITNPTGPDIKGGTPIFTGSHDVVLHRATVENEVKFLNPPHVWWFELVSGEGEKNVMARIRVDDSDQSGERRGLEVFQNERRVT